MQTAQVSEQRVRAAVRQQHSTAQEPEANVMAVPRECRTLVP